VSDDLSAAERLRRAVEAAEASQQPEDEGERYKNAKGRARADGKGDILGEIWRTAYLRYGFVKNAYDTIEVIFKSKIILVMTLGLSFVAQQYWRFCKWAFKTYSVDKETGDYDKKRGAIALIFLLLFTWFGVPFTARLSSEAVMIEGFSYWTTEIFSKPDLIDENRNIWSVSSCSRYPCEGETDTTEHRMTDSTWLDFKYLMTGRISHDPGELKGAFVSEENACNVKEYSYRLKVPFNISIPVVLPQNGFYPRIYVANCDSVNADNWKEVLDRKRAERPDLRR
jgi:hypothetical protein